jgi:hypothetical protein
MSKSNLNLPLGSNFCIVDNGNREDSMPNKAKHSIDTLIKALEKIYRATMVEKDHRYALKAIEMMAKIRGAFTAEKQEKNSKNVPDEARALLQQDTKLESLYAEITTQIATLEAEVAKQGPAEGEEA